MTHLWKTLKAAPLAGVLLLACRSNDPEPKFAADCLVQASATNGQPIAGAYIVTANLAGAVPSPNARVAAGQVETFLRERSVAVGPVELLTSAPQQLTFVTQLEPAEVETLRRDAAVQILEPDRVVSLCACVDVAVPSTLSWNIQQTGYGRGDLQTSRTAWVIDTGIDLDHPDLNIDTQRSRSFLTGESASSAEDLNGHGTHVAGIIGALNNGVGVTGVASGARLVALKVLDQLGEGRLSGVISAVNHVRLNGRAGDVVNLSLGGEGQSTTLDRAIQQAANVGILFAIAAGNESQSVEGQSPAGVNHPNVFTVSALNQQDQFAPFSNYGPSVDVAAYGVRVRSTYRDGRYATLSGTSMAAPHVAGLLYIRGNQLPTRGTALNDPDGQADPVARQ
jgi:hypothetical protein